MTRLPSRPTVWPAESRRVELEISPFNVVMRVTQPDAQGVDPKGAIILIPGFTGAKEDFISLTPLLTEAGYVTIAYDQPGQAESTGPDSTDYYQLESLARALTQISNWSSETFGTGTHWVGHSFGGLVATVGAAAEPTNARSVTLLCSGPGSLPAERRGAIPQVIPLLPQTPLADIWQLKVAMEQATGAPQPDEATLNMLRIRWVSNNPHAMLSKAKILTSDLDLMPLWHKTQGHRPRNSVHIVTGEHDDAWPVDVQEDLASSIAASFSVIADAGHSPALEKPQETAQILIRNFAVARS